MEKLYRLTFTGFLNNVTILNHFISEEIVI